MKQSLLLVPGFAWFVASSCCRLNSCLREIATEGVPGRNGLQDCSSHLAVTVTPSTQTVYKTTTVELTEAVTQVESKVSTSSETSTASTETVFFTVKASTTAVTETKLVTVFETVVAATETQTSTTTVTKVGLKARQDGGVVPSYASSFCKDFAEYKAACNCAGVQSVTVTAPTPVETLVVTETSSVQSTVLLTAAAVETITVLVTETTSQATTEFDLLTDTVTATTTETAFITTTTDATVTETASTCLKGIVWQPPSVSTSPSVQNKYIWSLDEEGRLGLALSVPPFTYKYTAYISTALTGSNWPQMCISTNVAAQVAAGARIDYVTGCVDAATGELHLNAAGRTNILWCGAQLWMSTGKGEDINRGTCVVMHPRAEKLA